MISDDKMNKRKVMLRNLLNFANTKLEELRKEWEAQDLSDAWLAKQTKEDQELLRSMNIKAEADPPENYPLIFSNDIPAVIKQMRRGKGNPRYAVLMFVPKDSSDGEHVNLQYSLIDGNIGMDWVLLGGRNKKDKKSITAFARHLGCELTPSELNRVKYLRYEGADLAMLGMRIVNEFYHFEPDEKVELLVEGFKWNGNAPINNPTIKLGRVGRLEVVCKSDHGNMHDRVVIQHPPRGLFTVLAQKCTETPLDPLPWETVNSFSDLQSPLELIKALEQAGELLGVDLEWSDVILGVASLDWVSAAVIADLKKGAIPALPPIEKLRQQRVLKDLGKVAIGVVWGYDSHDLGLHFATWIRILQGHSYSTRSRYFYEGEQFTAEWSFNIFGEVQLGVGYDDGGTGWEGALANMGYLKGPVLDGVDVAKLALQASPIAQDFPEAMTTWIMDGLCLYYRDTQLTLEQLEMYRVGEFLRSPIFVDVSPVERPQTTNCRYVIASSKAAPLFELNTEVAKWKLHTLGCNSFFKILDIQKAGDQSQIMLLHVPARGVWHLRSNAVSSLSPKADMKSLKQKALASFQLQKDLPPNPVFEDPEWLDRTSIPLGLELDGSLSPIETTTRLPPEAMNLLGAIRKMTNDNLLNTLQETKT